jgi:hypothetical protein
MCRRPTTRAKKPPTELKSGRGFSIGPHGLMTVIALTVLQTSRSVGAILLLLGILVGSARVVARVHWPLDILAGVVIGAAAVASARPIAGRMARSQGSSGPLNAMRSMTPVVHRHRGHRGDVDDKAKDRSCDPALAPGTDSDIGDAVQLDLATLRPDTHEHACRDRKSL